MPEGSLGGPESGKSDRKCQEVSKSDVPVTFTVPTVSGHLRTARTCLVPDLSRKVTVFVTFRASRREVADEGMFCAP